MNPMSVIPAYKRTIDELVDALIENIKERDEIIKKLRAEKDALPRMASDSEPDGTA